MGRADPLLVAASEPLPAVLQPVWDVLAELSHTRAPGGAPVTHMEVEAWQRLQGVRLTPWEVNTVLAADRASRVLPVERKDLSL